ncbi:MAG: ABC transporter permease subunit [Lachnospiraceae bacterium]|nr:ABC transporter permease subunit [Lachnospiraceae bacterium]
MKKESKKYQKPFKERVVRDFKMNKAVYLMLLPVIIYFVVYHYFPMIGLVAAFQDYKIKLGYLHSHFVGLKHFKRFFESIYAWRLIKNTFLISIKDIVWSYPLTIGFALLLNEVRNKGFKKFVQTVSYLPHFISMVVVCGLVMDFCKKGGILSIIVSFFTGTESSLLTEAGNFQGIFVGSGIWQGIGYGTIVYLSAISAISPELYEAAKVDGAGRLRQTWHITLPGILPTVVIMLILRVGSIMSVSYQKIILLYSPAVYETADVISSYVYRVGIAEGAEYSFSSAVGLFQSVVNLALIVIANKISAKVTETSLW